MLALEQRIALCLVHPVQHAEDAQRRSQQKRLQGQPLRNIETAIVLVMRTIDRYTNEDRAVNESNRLIGAPTSRNIRVRKVGEYILQVFDCAAVLSVT